MNRDEQQSLGKLWGAACEMQAGKSPGEDALRMVVRLLEPYDLAEVRSALGTHCRTSRFVPVPADIIGILEGALPSDEILAELATVDRTTLGRKARALIGSKTFDTAHPRAIISRMGALRGEIDDFRRRALMGRYTDSELRMLNSAGLDASGPLASGVPGPRLPYREAVRSAMQAAGSSRALQDETRSAPRTDHDTEAGKAAMKRIGSMLGGTVVSKRPAKHDVAATIERNKRDADLIAKLAGDPQ